MADQYDNQGRLHGLVNQGRRRFLIGSAVVISANGLALTALPFVKTWLPSARADCWPG